MIDNGSLYHPFTLLDTFCLKRQMLSSTDRRNQFPEINRSLPVKRDLKNIIYTYITMKR